MNPYLNFSVSIDENLLFRDTKIAKMLHQYLESLKANPQHVQGIQEGDIIDLSQSHLYLIEVDAGGIGTRAEFMRRFIDECAY